MATELMGVDAPWPMVMMMRLVVGLAITGSVLLAAQSMPGDQPGRSQQIQLIRLEREVANIEISVGELELGKPKSTTRLNGAAVEAWFGKVPRRLRGDGPRDDSHFAIFAVKYEAGIARRVWCDSNLNDDLTDDPAPPMSIYPGIEGTRSFLVDLSWQAEYRDRTIPVAWKLRIVLEPQRTVRLRPVYHVQTVYAMLGRALLDGTTHRVLLLDGNGDGIHTREFADGMVVDEDDDRHFEIDQMSPTFGPLSVPFQIGRSVYEAVDVDPEGRSVTLRFLRQAAPVAIARIGEAAPDFTFKDQTGKSIQLTKLRGRPVLIYFWASWCGSNQVMASELRRIRSQFGPEKVQILGISFDTDRGAMEASARTNGHSWPTSFSGLLAWEDSVGRLYQVRSPGSVYLVDPAGALDSVHDKSDELGARVTHLLAATPNSQAGSPGDIAPSASRQRLLGRPRL